MPKKSSKTKEARSGGVLYIIATPIGNPDDITVRALNILGKVDWTAAEDTRNTGRLFSHHKIKSRLVSFHEHNEKDRADELIKKIKNGETVAMVSDAGTPSISDPGYRLVRAAIRENITVIPVPGPSAAIAALSVSGLPTDSFVFAGFLPKTRGKRLKRLGKLADETGTIIFYESPKRVLRLIEEIIEEIGDRDGVLCREMTKTYEEFVRGSLSEIHAGLKNRNTVKGECTLLVSGHCEIKTASLETVRKEIAGGLEENKLKPSALAKEIAEKTGFPKKEVYEELLRMKDENK